MNFLLYGMEKRYLTLTIVTLLAVLCAIGWILNPAWYLEFGALLALAVMAVVVGVHDMIQTRHAILRNYPLIGHMRFLMEMIRPELRQYFFEADTDGRPFPRERRAIVYQRAKGQLDKRPFGTHADIYSAGYEWMLHSIMPAPVVHEPFRVMIGGPTCTQPYNSSIFNISAMSYGALSANAIRALNKGAKMGNFAHDTGEGSVSPYHREGGGDLIWEIGSGYFGCRNADGSFSPENFAKTAADPQIRMIEIKLSQGAKPGHGGVLPGPKVTAEIAEIRGVAQGVDCVSPASHSAFSTPMGLIQFVEQLRKLSHGKPVGFKLCIGHRTEFLAIIKAMLESKITPDFIVVDGKEGGTGAAPAEFMDNLGMPMRDGLAFVHAALVGAGLRDRVKIGCAGKIITGFDMARAFALGADWCNAARGFMFAVGCIQAQACHTGHCPTGVATQDKMRQRAIVVGDKATRVANFQRETINSLAELLAAAGLTSPRDLKPHHILRRGGAGKVVSLANQFVAVHDGDLLNGKVPEPWKRPWATARAEAF
ncbi:FMN-binding glutamate synthase family protein [Aestuariivirga litoralis]|uniref:FMN-binding glutamate synthase family protein n=1 Tax=Aestuariivirga litoralis TaxID=2650924 RepID=UPI0018C4934A|nr:FMN-binding glutamate synthase family protein [Aestuariivirga litoralis]MBG1233057.1 FMN-binding glutamate synthase family protein [Aestuariivirga litoralis]